MFLNITKLLTSDPNFLDLGIFSAMWNEHCSYKSSRIHLTKLPTKGNQVIQVPWENAGVIDTGDNDAIIFKIESQEEEAISDINLAYAIIVIEVSDWDFEIKKVNIEKIIKFFEKALTL